MTTSFGVVPKGSVLSYQSLEFERLDRSKQPTVKVLQLPSLALGLLENTACVYEISDESVRQAEGHIGRSSCIGAYSTSKQQSSCTKWQTSRVGRVTASRFGNVLLRRSLPTDALTNSFFEAKDYASLPVQLSHAWKSIRDKGS